MKLTKHIFTALAVAGAMTLAACSDDDTYDVYGNPDLLVYINLPTEPATGMPSSTFAYTVYHTPVGPFVIKSPENVEISVTATRKATTDITVTLEVDPTLEVPGYAAVPANAGITVVLESNTLTIPAGSNTSSAAVKVNINADNANWAALTEAAYVIPIKITQATGATPSELHGCAYVGVATQVKDGMVNPDATSVDGEAITDTDGWTGTWSAPDAGAGGDIDIAQMSDNNRSTYPVMIFNHADKVNEEVIINLDLGKPYTVRGMFLRYFYLWYTVKDATLETSLDGVSYTTQGTVSWTNNSYQRYIALWAPMSMRYIRLTTHSYYGGTGEGTVLSDIILYQ